MTKGDIILSQITNSPVAHFKALREVLHNGQGNLSIAYLTALRGAKKPVKSQAIHKENEIMKQQLEIINEQEVLGKDFKIYGTFENPLFLAKDVAEWIEYTKTSQGYYNVSKMLQTVDEEEKLLSSLVIAGQGREMWFLTEDGLYEVLMQSRKPIAKAFKKEVKKILKEIRKTGSYTVQQTQSNVPQLSLEKQLILELFDKRNNPAEFVLAVGNYGDYKFEEGGRFICNESIITLPRVAEMIQHTLQDELDKLNYHPIMTQLGSEFIRFLVQEGYLEPRLFPSVSGWGTEKRRHSQPTQMFYDVFVSQAMATAREIADGRGKVEIAFTNNIYKYILSDSFKANFMKFIYKTHPLLVELMESNSISLLQR